ncbi:MAG: ribosome maturation factor RimM [Geobacteraceae bacterium]
MPEAHELIPIGKVLGPHGIRGQLRVIPYSGDPASITSLRMVLLRAPDGPYDTYEIAKAVVHKKHVLITLKGFDNINQVLALAGREIYVRRDQFPQLPEDEYYWCDLIGLVVQTEAGETLGELVDIFETGSNDVYVVSAGTREILIPATEEVVLDINLVAGTMVIRPPDGLLDL